MYILYENGKLNHNKKKINNQPPTQKHTVKYYKYYKYIYIRG